jgi:hypothetical protein
VIFTVKRKRSTTKTKGDVNIDPLSNENLLNYNTQGGEADQVKKQKKYIKKIGKISILKMKIHFCLFKE